MGKRTSLFCILPSALIFCVGGAQEIQKNPERQRIVTGVDAPRSEPIRTGGALPGRDLLHKVDPKYPPEAKKARISGMVILEVVVNEKGEVYSARVLRGHPMLNPAALDAVCLWRFRPAIWHGEAVPKIGTVTLRFDPNQEKNILPRPGLRGSTSDS